MNTSQEYDQVIKQCRDLFAAKLKDYGASWRIFRLPSVTDQIFIKANRIRQFQESGVMKIDEGILDEFIGIINYSIIALIQLELGVAKDDKDKLELEKALELYDKYSQNAKSLMENKNHDYSEAWRSMRVSSIVDLILVKIMRLKNIEDNYGKVVVSEGEDANYYDIINYGVFASIKIQ
ncbi:hypothetical protein SDC9_15736 [bioreactor metagenome]|jgi:hypothetical protein|uniref:Nucleotide modification associated domain-containing protein n=1 Tax=bioreactor metagenome TaxID=1076179 RepID=A0A644TSX9_9ZZZZ|nr:DUF1599 domain-containing protein [Bacteroidales bacterium]MEA4968249.1 DUF1599 domain-containing protein [Bacteroidaceae bacterium]MEA5100179.1 DUF1599 domain-containing protein [Bacteroidales bacterium]